MFAVVKSINLNSLINKVWMPIMYMVERAGLICDTQTLFFRRLYIC